MSLVDELEGVGGHGVDELGFVYGGGVDDTELEDLLGQEFVVVDDREDDFNVPGLVGSSHGVVILVDKVTVVTTVSNVVVLDDSDDDFELVGLVDSSHGVVILVVKVTVVTTVSNGVMLGRSLSLEDVVGIKLLSVLCERSSHWADN